MEALSEAIKVFAEKHLIPTVASLFVGGIVLLVMPSDHEAVQKLTSIGFCLLVSGGVFLAIQAVLWVIKAIKNSISVRLIRERNLESKRNIAKRNLEVLWDYVDNLCQEDRNLLKQFIKTKNAPYVIRGHFFYSSGRLLSSADVHQQQGYDEQGGYTKYVLSDSLYQALVASVELYGRISRFEEV